MISTSLPLRAILYARLPTALRRTRVGDIRVEQCESVPSLIARLKEEDFELPEEMKKEENKKE